MLVLSIAENLHELLQNRSVTAVASLGELRRVVVMAIYFALVLIVRVLCAKNCGTDRAGKMLNVVLAVQCGDIRSS
jgi:hypothetical protein